MELEGRRILVTGGAGFIGSHLVDALAASNQVTVLDDLSTGRMENLSSAGPRVRLIRGDVTDAACLEEPVRDAEVIFHLAVICLREAIGNPLRAHQVNDLGTLNLLLAARSAPRLERFVYVSSSEVYGSATGAPLAEDHPVQPMTPYAAGKLAGETYALSFWQTYGMPVTVIRPFNAYGPRAHVRGTSGELIPRLVAMALAGRPLPVFGDGRQSRDFTWVGDTVRGVALGAACDALVGGRVNIAHGEGVTVLRIAQLVQDVLGAPVGVEHLPPRPGDVLRQHADVRRAREVLDFRASVPIEDGIRRYVDWVTRQPAAAFRLDDEEIVNWRLQPLPV